MAKDGCSPRIESDIANCTVFKSNEEIPEVNNGQGSQTVHEQRHLLKHRFLSVQVLLRRNLQSNPALRVRENSSVAVAGTTFSTDTERDLRRKMLRDLTADLKISTLYHRRVNNRFNSYLTLEETSKDKNDTIDQKKTEDHRLAESVRVW